MARRRSRSRSWTQDDLAEHVTGFQSLLRGGSIGEWELCVDGGGKPSVEELLPRGPNSSGQYGSEPTIFAPEWNRNPRLGMVAASPLVLPQQTRRPPMASEKIDGANNAVPT